MDRLGVIQAVIERRRSRNYLEIGVKKGKVFLNVRARKKLAVDPELKIPFKHKIRACVRYPLNLFNESYEMTSDDFFRIHQNRLLRLHGLGTVFIDGLHTYEQSWKDVFNSVEHLRPDGVIIMHDCNPTSAAEAMPAASRADAAFITAAPRSENWSGDTWKTILRLRAEREDLRVCVLDCDHGVGIIFRGQSENRLSLSVREIEEMGYDDLQKNRMRFLNLSDPNRLQTILSD